ncbi:MAG: hypothetical protein QXY21_01740 [Candidatus Micrarchaeaceae archaeon]
MRSLMLFIYILFATFIIGISSSTTVTLTGSCSSSIIQINGSNAFLFNLSNSGNGPAQNLTLLTSPYGLSASNVETLSILQPNTLHSFTFFVKNITYPGTYAVGIYVAYQQGTQTFAVSFPCIIYYKYYSIPLLIKSQNVKINGGILSFNVTNIVNYPISATAYFIAPPGIKFNKSIVNFTVSPLNTYHVAVSINESALEGLNMNINVVAIVYYIKNNTHYSLAFSPVSINLLTIKPSNTPLNYLLYTSIILIILLIILLIYAFVRRSFKRNKKKEIN